jgi:hypothetical protein
MNPAGLVMGKVANSSVEMLKAEINPNAIRKKIRYGPFHMPSSEKVTLMSLVTGEHGMYTTNKQIDIGCKDCTLLSARGELVYPDGSLANINTGAWFHHFVLMNSGKGRKMLGCPGFMAPEGLPGGGKVRNLPVPDIIIGVGEERSRILFTDPNGGTKSGYYVKPDDTITLVLELMNTLPKARDVYVDLDVEYLPGKQRDFSNSQCVYLSVKPCSPEGFRPDNDKITLTSTGWKAPWDGEVISYVGHMHDGAVGVSVAHENVTFCDSVATYGGNPLFIEPPQTPGGKPVPSISNQSQCLPHLKFKKGDDFTITGRFDATQHPYLLDGKGKPQDVMAMSIMCMAIPASVYA